MMAHMNMAIAMDENEFFVFVLSNRGDVLQAALPLCPGQSFVLMSTDMSMHRSIHECAITHTPPYVL